VTANQMAHLSDPEGTRSTAQTEPLTSYTVGRIQKGYNAGNTVIGGMFTSTNRVIDDPSLEFLARNAYTGGLDLLTHWKDKEFFLDAKLTGSYINGSAQSLRRLQESPAHYFQRPGIRYIDYDTTRKDMAGSGGRVQVGKGSKGFWRYSAGVDWASPGLELNDLGYMREADYIRETNEVSYLINKPVSVFNFYTVSLEQFNEWNFGGKYLGSGGHLNFHSQFKNNWSFGGNLIYHSRRTDMRILRGGPDMLLPHSFTTFGNITTDVSKKITGQLNWEAESRGSNSGFTWMLQPGITVRPLSALKLGVTADYSANTDRLQYVTAKKFQSDQKYILGTIDQKTFGLTFRADLILSPEFSIQYYGSPFISKGTYSEFKHITDAEAGKLNDRYSHYMNTVWDNNLVYLDQNNDFSPDIIIANPDFDFYQFRSNLVAKWEYRLGSYLYLVWSRDKTGRDGFPENIFLVKLNYWFSL
ncbi:MAG TPA: DUF5916 domain-containing protein, partial [Bacteroidales bacterium]|nr:DUF5916 domain-containing protein [Bacteroidales bacterium]